MRDTSLAVPPISYSPMPDRLHRRYLRLWHVLTIGFLVFALSMGLWDTRTSWGERQAALIALVSLLIAIYIKSFVLPHLWPLPWRWLAGYFLGRLRLWLIEVSLDSHFIDLCGGMYLSQMHFLLPPRLAIPATPVLF